MGGWERRQNSTLLTRRSRSKRAPQFEYHLAYEVLAKEKPAKVNRKQKVENTKQTNTTPSRKSKITKLQVDKNDQDTTLKKTKNNETHVHRSGFSNYFYSKSIPFKRCNSPNSFLICSFHVFLGLHRPRLPSIMMLSTLTTGASSDLFYA